MSLREETLLWQFIDGECSPEEAQQVCRMLETNQELQIAFQKLMRLHQMMQSMGNKGSERPMSSFNETNIPSSNENGTNWSNHFHAAIILGISLLALTSAVRLFF